MKPIILTFTHYYLPGNLAGGPICSIANMVELLSDEFEFHIITSDRDYGAGEPYKEVKLDQWNRVGNARVFYTSAATLSLRRLAKLIRATPHDVIYLNSFFDPVFTIQPLIARRLGLITKKKPLIIAPRGEFSEGAFTLKHWKKAPYALLSKWLGLYDGILWHASTIFEKKDIEQHFKSKSSSRTANTISIAIDLVAPQNTVLQSTKFSSVLVAANLISLSQPLSKPLSQLARKPLQMCFLSRICPKKNLDYALRILADVKVPLCFNIYGPQEDHAYWAKCQLLIAKLPDHIQVFYKGSINHQNVVNTLAQHDLFFFPTLGENFGHVIHEALRAGIPVLLSDQTPWLDLEQKGVGWSLPLNNPSGFVQAIEEVAGWSAETRQSVSQKVFAYADETGDNTQAIEQNLALFRRALLAH